MSEQPIPVLDEKPSGVPPAPSGSKKKKKKKRSIIKTIVALILIAAVVVGIIVALYFLVFKDENTLGEAMTDFVSRGSIQSIVEGYGLTKAKDSATITPGSGTLLELYVHEGDQVTEGQPLYVMDDTPAQEAIASAREAVAAAQETVNERAKALQDVNDSIKDLTVTSPHAGKLIEVTTLKAGDMVDNGTKLATLVNDTKLRLSLYYNYAYENDIYAGQSAQVSIPAIMGSRDGTVEQINKVRFISPEGGIYFEVILTIDNPGTLTQGMDASAALTDAAGAPIYPYENGKLEYYETTDITAKARGPVEYVDLLRYADVTEGQLLVRLGTDELDQEIAARQENLKAAQDVLDEANKRLEEAVKELDKYNAVAPISGTVLSCNLVEGSEVQGGQGITIADTTVMTLDINIDERNLQYVKTGMMVDINYQGMYYMGILESVSLTGTAENGMSTFPAVVSVDNYDGMIMSNSYANYSFVASQSENCLIVPVNSVKYVSFANIPGIEDLIALSPTDDGGNFDDYNFDGGMDGFEDSYFEDGMDGNFADDGEIYPEDGEMLEPGDGDITILPDEGGGIAVPEDYTGGAFAQPLGVIVAPAGGMYSSSSSGSSSGGSRASSAISEDGTGYIVFVRAAEPPVNAILEPDPAWECPEGFWAVPVETGLSNTTQVEILSGLNEGDEIFIGYMTNSSWG